MAGQRTPTLRRLSGVPLDRIESIYAGSAVRVDRVQASLAHAESISVCLQTTTIVLIESGTVAVANPSDGSLSLLSPGVVVLVPASMECTGIASAGEHRWKTLEWTPTSLPNLTRLLQHAPASHSFSSACRSALPVDFEPLESLQEGTDRLICDFDLLSIALRTAPRLLSLGRQVSIAPCPNGLLEPIGPLVREVRSNPQARWSLSEAADSAGYSTFHFSRTFKQAVGCGFHEFVDRCRTEVALRLLSTDSDPASISEAAGFPSLRAMRESIKDYLGLSLADLVRLRNQAKGVSSPQNPAKHRRIVGVSPGEST